MSKKIEEKYKILSQLEHVLLRPTTYVGSNKPHTENKWILNTDKFSKKEVTIIPSFIKIFDEVLMNSVDESKRNKKLNRIEVTIDLKENSISVLDNGGIPVVIHQEYGIFIPEVVFGALMSGSNYNDDDERIVAGLNGLGAKLTNIFSKRFIVTTCDGKKKFHQEFTDNMRSRTPATISNSRKAFTQIKWFPDLEKFGLDGIDDDHFQILKKRVIDVAACNNDLDIIFNGEKVSFKSFEEYVSLYVNNYFSESNKDKTWSVSVALSESGFQQVSFVNSTETYDGGTHVEFIMSQIITELRAFFLRKHKTDVKPSELRNHMFLFLNSTIVNPAFSSQTKEKLITEQKEFNDVFEISSKLVNAILKSEIVHSILDWIEQKKKADESKAARQLNKSLDKIKVDKLIDAKGKDRRNCQIFLFEGDCLHEDTLIRVLRDGEFKNVKIKEAQIDDIVITHNDSLSTVYAVSKKIKKKAIIRTSNNEVICSRTHKWFIYDIPNNEFRFETTENLDKKNHKLVKNYLAFMEDLFRIKEVKIDSVELVSDITINTNPEHGFAVWNRETNKFEMVKHKNLNSEIHFLVGTFNK